MELMLFNFTKFRQKIIKSDFIVEEVITTQEETELYFHFSKGNTQLTPSRSLLKDINIELEENEKETLGPKMRFLSEKIVSAIQFSSSLKVKQLALLFLIEDSPTKDAWFVGVDSLSLWEVSYRQAKESPRSKIYHGIVETAKYKINLSKSVSANNRNQSASSSIRKIMTRSSHKISKKYIDRTIQNEADNNTEVNYEENDHQQTWTNSTDYNKTKSDK